jgi:hypothetical protein
MDLSKSLDEIIKEQLNEEVVIPPELSNQYLSVKKQIVDKQSKKDRLMKSVNQLDNEINILQKNLLGIENQAAKTQEKTQQDVQGQTGEGEKKTIELEAKVKESIDLDKWWKDYYISEAIDEEDRFDGDDEKIEMMGDKEEDPTYGEDELSDEEKDEAEQSLDGDYVFAIKILTDDEEDIIAKFYKDDDDEFWKGRVVQGDESRVERMQFDPDLDKLGVIQELSEIMEDDIIEVDIDTYQELLDDKEKLDDLFYGDENQEDITYEDIIEK